MSSLLLQFEEEHFGNLCGARRAIKDETRQLIMKRKIGTTERILKWLVDDTGLEAVPQLVDKIENLGRDKDGYFALHPKASSTKGKQNQQVF